MQTLDSRVLLVTGATDGLGRKVAHDLAARRATVLLHGRDPEKGEAVVREIRQATGNRRLTYYDADFASLEAVRYLSRRIIAEQARLDGLINNAGIGGGMRGGQREQSRDGHELRFAVNYLAPFLLTHRLLPLLRRSAPARVVNVASIGQQAIAFDDVMLEDGYDGLRAYCQSKLAQVMFTFDLAEALAGTGITVNSLHPATLMNTKMVFGTDYFNGPVSTVAEGADAVVDLAVSAALDGVTGEFFDGRQRSRANAQAYDSKARLRLRTLSEKLARIDRADD